MNPTFPIWVLYTYQTVDGEQVCNTYGYVTEADAQGAGEKLAAELPVGQDGRIGFMVLPLQAAAT